LRSGAYRQSTLDVDTVARIEAELADAVAAVARVDDLAPAWLNDASAPLASADLRASGLRSTA
jgi:hypothetical protein